MTLATKMTTSAKKITNDDDTCTSDDDSYDDDDDNFRSRYTCNETPDSKKIHIILHAAAVDELFVARVTIINKFIKIN